MASPALQSKIQDLSDIELAFLLCLTAHEHCIIHTSASALDDLAQELRLIASNTFALTHTSTPCTPHTTLDDLLLSLFPSLLTPSGPSGGGTQQVPPSPGLSRTSTTITSSNNNNSSSNGTSYFPLPLTRINTSSTYNNIQLPGPHSGTSTTKIANTVILKNLHVAPKAVQIQVLELIRTGRCYVRGSVQWAPRDFVVCIIVGEDESQEVAGHGQHEENGDGEDDEEIEERGGVRMVLNKHLNEALFISHYHDPLDGFANIEELELEREQTEREGDGGGEESDAGSLRSVVRRRSGTTIGTGAEMLIPTREPVFDMRDVEELRKRAEGTVVSVEVKAYMMNIVAFLRLHRAVGSHVTQAATKHFDKLVRFLAPLHGLDYATPALVALAARKIYPHRIAIVEPKNERSMQWGSDIDAVTAALEDIEPEDVVEDVLGMVEVPL